ncbi:phage tail sheath C-terminal domain-containing protein [Oceanirhabdus sp. W0125-5]|uniref:phage tail sheath C-terminal domain-containing protein n=1 Tax=Oceanirhabdus sp. W0125-5 TaxID=2999116 RepID=UPI0022F3412F|nr:phage tail sheath C-terminal domain-containing protein [Oceanirhabdus sp. W0125-5]WBW96051.1 phage tail sheath C-terminal domain-containing protein [Oceanirhabdus sp. W0125-5]
MGLPRIDINFKQAATALVKRAQKGVVALILRDTSGIGVHTIKSVTDIPTDLSDYNKKQISMALKGTVNPPSKIIAYVQQSTAADYNEPMEYFGAVNFNYLAVPGINEADVSLIATWIIGLRTNENIRVKAVLPDCSENNEGIIKFTSTDIEVEEGGAVVKYQAADYCSRIAGALAGLPLNMSATYQVLPEIVGVAKLSKEEANKKIDDGELILINDGEKVKIARGVNSLTQTTPDKGNDFKKIKIVDTMDMIETDIRRLIEDNYIGKMPNTYDNKCILITAIKVYFEQLEREQILDKDMNTVGIDMELQTSFLKGIGEDVDLMNEQQIKAANTKDQVFLVSEIKIVDAMEEITFNINM